MVSTSRRDHRQVRTVARKRYTIQARVHVSFVRGRTKHTRVGRFSGDIRERRHDATARRLDEPRL